MASVSKAKKAKPTLARPGDPLILANGMKIIPEAMPDEEENVETQFDASEFHPIAQRSIKDLPLEPRAMTGIAAVLVYTVLGLSDGEIAETLGVTLESVEQAKDSPAYGEAFNMLAAEFINANSELIASRIASYSHGALTTLANIARNGKQEGNQMRASMYLMDAGGHNKKGDIGKHAEDGLKIVVTNGDESTVEVNVNLGG